jgi:cytochrome c oxidase assembly protein subunit 15
MQVLKFSVSVVLVIVIAVCTLLTIGTTEEAATRNVGYWLIGVSGLIFGMVTVGGITRLTRSGLSMTDWKLQGSLPPLSNEHWQVEFERSNGLP